MANPKIVPVCMRIKGSNVWHAITSVRPWFSWAKRIIGEHDDTVCLRSLRIHEVAIRRPTCKECLREIERLEAQVAEVSN